MKSNEMKINTDSQSNKLESQTEVTQIVRDFLGDRKIETKDDLIDLLKFMHSSLESRDYNDETKEHADSVQWKRSATEIIHDGFVYDGKACSDLAMVFVSLCKAAGLEANLIKLVRLDHKSTHTIVEVKLSDGWYRLDTSNDKCIPTKGYLEADQIWNKNWEGGWKVWKRGPDLQSMGLYSIDSEIDVYKD